MTLIRAFAILSLAGLAACTAPPDVSKPVVPIGDFRMGHNIVVANEPTQGPLSRDATSEELETAVRDAIQARLGRFDGDGLYHVGVRVEAYVLAQPGIPIVLSPKSVLLLALNVWDNATQERLNEEPIRITAFEGLNTGPPLLPSGLVKSKEEQLENLAISAAQEIERVLREYEDTWFATKPDRTRVEFSPASAEPAAAGAATVEPAAN